MSVAATYARARDGARRRRGPSARAAAERNQQDRGRNVLRYRLSGLIQDTPAAEVPVRAEGGLLRTAWTTAVNVRERDMSRERVGGWKVVHDAGHPGANGGAYGLAAIPAEFAAWPFWLAWGAGGIYVTDGVAWTLLSTPTPTPTAREFWATNFQSHTVVGGAQSGPVYVDWATGTPSATALLPGWPETGGVPDWRCRVMHTVGSFLIAAGMDESGTPLEDRVRWSDAADPGTLPDVWVPAADNLAGDATLVGSGPFTAAEELRGSSIIYRERETWIGTFVGAPYVWDYRRLFKGRGANGPGCVVALEGRHYVVSGDEFGVHDGVNWQALSAGKVRRRLRALQATRQPELGIGRLRYVPRTREIWYAVPQEDGYCHEAMIFSLDSGEFTWRELGEVAESFDVGTVVDPTRPLTWGDDGEAWRDDPSIWNATDQSHEGIPVFSAGAGAPVSVAIGNQMRAFDFATDDGARPLRWRLERAGLDLGDPHSVDAVHEVWPRMFELGAAGYADIRVGATMNERQPYQWSPTQRITAGTDKIEIDPPMEGRYHAIEIASDAPEFSRVAGFDLVTSRLGDQ